MKNIFSSVALTFLSVAAFAGKPVSKQDVVAAIMANQEITSIIEVIKSERDLSCEVLSEKNIVLKKSGTVRAAFDCNDTHGGANVHTIYVTGSLNATPDAKLFVNFVSLSVQAFE